MRDTFAVLSTDVRIKSRTEVKGKDASHTVYKATIVEHDESSMLKRTTSGELADLEVRYLRRGHSIEIVHLHCMKDHETSEYSRGKGMDLDKLYVITKNGLVQCKTCKRVWRIDASGDEIKVQHKFPGYPQPVTIAGTPDGKLRNVSDAELEAFYETTEVAKAGIEPPFITRTKQRLAKAKEAEKRGR
jgi:hypothetical protein